MGGVAEVRSRTIHISKKGIRVLGIAESFKPEIMPKKSILTGVVMRGDFFIDGFGFNLVTLGGMDATNRVIELVKELDRPDISFIMLNGTVIALYNVIDLIRVYRETKLPIIAISYEESEGIDKYLLERPCGEERLKTHKRNGPRITVKLRNGFNVFIRPVGMDLNTAVFLLNKFTIHGRYPEPIKVAKILSRSILFFLSSRIKDLTNIFSKII